MCEHSMQLDLFGSTGGLMPLLADSPVRTLPAHGTVPVLTETEADYGLNTCDSLPDSSRDMSLLKTSPISENEDSDWFLKDLPVSGTMRRGKPYPLLMSALPMNEADYSSLHGVIGSQWYLLATALRKTMRPLSAQTAEMIIQSAIALGHIQQKTLDTNWQKKIGALLPTPTCQDAKNNAGPSQFQRNTLPMNALIGGALNPDWIEWVQGFPIGWTDCMRSVIR